MILRPATQDDTDRLFEIHREALKYYVELTWGWDEKWQIDHFRENFDPMTRHVISIENDDIGFVDIEVKADFIDVKNIEIEPNSQGRGIGTEVIRRVVAVARYRGLPIILQVLKVNPRARSLYVRLGFVEVGENDAHILMEAVHDL